VKLHRCAENLLIFHCPGCNYGHAVRVGGEGPVWEWNESMSVPTFYPSIVVQASQPQLRCHSFVSQGKIQFLDDSFHELRGKTVDIPDWEP